MQEEQNANPVQSQQNDQKRQLKRTLLVVSVSLLFILGAAYGVYAWQHKKVTTLNATVSDLQSRVSTLEKTKETANTQETSLSTDTPEKTKADLKGTVIIYNASSPAETLNGIKFKTDGGWYLVPKDVRFPGNESTDYKLDLSKATCNIYGNDGKIGQTGSCLTTKGWAYGDRARISGTVSGMDMTVSKMDIVSALPVNQW